MVRFPSTGVAVALVACSPSFGTHAEETTCSDMAGLGTNSWERFGAEVDIQVDNNCQYSWTLSFKHDESLPVPDDPANECDPSIQPPALASDGLPYFAFRWHYEKAPDYVAKATGIDHISIDFNPCGHPPANVFTAPHYDFHTYRVSPEFRTCMLCDLIPGTPVCDFTITQSTDSGKAFFAPITQDLPANYVNFETDAVAKMGGHAWNPEEQPATTAEFSKPVMVMGTYDGNNLYYEPMPPLSFLSGPDDSFWEETIVYENQQTANLATYASVSYEASTGTIKATFQGSSSVCQYEFADLKNGGGGLFGRFQDFIVGIFSFVWSLLFFWI